MAIFSLILFYLITKQYSNAKADGFNTTKTVNLFDLSITSNPNFCGPTAKCYLTGKQCFYDTDCVQIEEDGVKESFINERPPIANLGVNTWSSSFNAGQRLFDKRYKSNQLEFMPNYPSQYTLTGNFIVQEPVGYR